MMSDPMQELRADEGKSTSAHHCAHKAKCVNWIIFGCNEPIARVNRVQADLVLMEKIRAKNAIWIARTRTYARRKATLQARVAALNTKMIGGEL